VETPLQLAVAQTNTDTLTLYTNLALYVVDKQIKHCKCGNVFGDILSLCYC